MSEIAPHDRRSSSNEHAALAIVALQPEHIDELSKAPHPAPYQGFTVPCWEEFSAGIADPAAFLSASLAVMHAHTTVAAFFPFRCQDDDSLTISWRILPRYSEGDAASEAVLRAGLEAMRERHPDRPLRAFFRLHNVAGIQTIERMGFRKGAQCDIDGVAVQTMEWPL